MLELWEQDRGINMKKLWIVLMLLFLSVSPVRADIVTLEWDGPTTNVDGSPLTDLGGYRVYYGNQSGVYGTPVDVGNVTSYVINLSDGNWFFAVTSYDTSGNESDYSNECNKLIDTIKPSPPGGFSCSF